MPSPLRAAPRAWLSLTTRCLCLLESDQVRNEGPEGGHGGGCGPLRGSRPGERARVHPGDSPTLSKGAMVWQRVGKGMGPPSAAALSGNQPARGLLTSFPSTLPLASHSPCACVCAVYVHMCLCVCVHHVGMYMCATVSVCCVYVNVYTRPRGVQYRPALRPPPMSPRSAEASGPVLLSSCQPWLGKLRPLPLHLLQPFSPSSWPSSGSGFPALAQVGVGCISPFWDPLPFSRCEGPGQGTTGGNHAAV